MQFRYLEKDNNHPIIDHFYELKISKEDLPFTSLILPLGQTNITCIKCAKDQISKHPNKAPIFFNGLIVTGQAYGFYEVTIVEESYNFGFGLKPTSLYKLTGKDVSKFNNNHVNINQLTDDFFIKLKAIFEENSNNIHQFIKAIYTFFEKLPFAKDQNIGYLEKAIDLIEEKEGLIKVSDLLDNIPFSQKKLELQFKKIIGLTPGKYIKQYRFMKLMQKYNSREISMSDLQYMFNYYDASHFAKDFQFFMNQTPKSYFKKDYPLLMSYLKE